MKVLLNPHISYKSIFKILKIKVNINELLSEKINLAIVIINGIKGSNLEKNGKPLMESAAVELRNVIIFKLDEFLLSRLKKLDNADCKSDELALLTFLIGVIALFFNNSLLFFNIFISTDDVFMSLIRIHINTSFNILIDLKIV